jgi:hypothetical protein
MQYKIIPLLCIILVCSSFVILPSYGVDWNEWRQASCMPDNCFCEKVNLNYILRQPANTISSFSFVFFGIFSFISLNFRNKILSDKKRQKLYINILIFSVIMIGFGSSFYHASLSFLGQFFDVFSMYLLVTYILVYNWKRKFSLNIINFGIIYFILNLALAILLVNYPETRRFLFALVLVLALIFEYHFIYLQKPGSYVKLLNISLLTFAIAYSTWLLDNFRVLCDSSSLMQGHSVWHILCALSSYLLILYYEKELEQNIISSAK